MKHTTCLGLAIGVLIIVILISINYSYKNKNKNKIENFNSVPPKIDDIILDINKNKNYLENIQNNLAKIYLKYPNDENDINAYISSNNIIESSDKSKLKQIFNLNFLQHLQNQEIERLESDLKELESKKPNDNNNKLTKGLKNIASGAILKVGYKDKGEYDFIVKPKFSLIMDENKQSCLETLHYKKETTDGEVETVKEVGCDYDINANQQKFSYQKIDGNKKFNNALHPDSKQHSIADYYRLNNYPFYIVHPFQKQNNGTYDINEKDCLTLNDDGLSVEPCNLKHSQRFLLSDL
jgi:hypothetical protein